MATETKEVDTVSEKVREATGIAGMGQAVGACTRRFLNCSKMHWFRKVQFSSLDDSEQVQTNELDFLKIHFKLCAYL